MPATKRTKIKPKVRFGKFGPASDKHTRDDKRFTYEAYQDLPVYAKGKRFPVGFIRKIVRVHIGVRWGSLGGWRQPLPGKRHYSTKPGRREVLRYELRAGKRKTKVDAFKVRKLDQALGKVATTMALNRAKNAARKRWS